jgi:His/Glu/Gln/Arg/opine family amino acid ABC transporter permease subunit
LPLLSDPSVQLYLASLPSALLTTLQMTIGGTVIATIGGLLLALGSRARSRAVVRLSRGITYVVRAIPQPPVLLLAYFGLEALLGGTQPEEAAMITLGVLLAPWMGELFRSGIQAVPVGQIEAGRALGLSETAVQRRIVLPLAVRIMFPAFGQLVVGLMLSTSIASQLGTKDVTGLARPIINGFFATDLWLVVAAVYFLAAFPLSRLLNWIERRTAIVQ